MNWNISAWSIRQPVPSLVLFMVLMALGYVSFGAAAGHALSQHRRADRAGARLPVGRGAVRARGAGHQEDRGRHRRRQRRQAQTSTITEGSSVTTIEFRLEINQDRALNDVKDAIARIRAELPRTIDEPIIAAHRDRGPADRHLRGAARPA